MLKHGLRQPIPSSINRQTFRPDSSESCIGRAPAAEDDLIPFSGTSPPADHLKQTETATEIPSSSIEDDFPIRPPRRDIVCNPDAFDDIHNPVFSYQCDAGPRGNPHEKSVVSILKYERYLIIAEGFDEDRLSFRNFQFDFCRLPSVH